jgi:RNA-dependent RNA polymerase
MLEDNQISRGVRFELARLISAGLIKYDEITQEKVKACRGSNHEAVSTIRTIFLKNTRDNVNDPAFAQEYAAKVRFLVFSSKYT